MIGDLKDLFNILQKAGKIDEYQKILDLIDEQFKNRQKIEELEKENKNLHEKQLIQENLEFKNNSYWKKSNGDGPFCSRCWDKNKLLIRIIPTFLAGNYADCPECKNRFNYTGKEESRVVNRAVSYDY